MILDSGLLFWGHPVYLGLLVLLHLITGNDNAYRDCIER